MATQGTAVSGTLVLASLFSPGGCCLLLLEISEMFIAIHFVIRLLSALASQLWVAHRKLGNSPHQCYIEQDFFGYVFKYLYSKYKKPISRPCFNYNP